MQVGNLTENANRDNPNTERVYDARGISPTITVMGGGNREPRVIVDE